MGEHMWDKTIENNFPLSLMFRINITIISY